MNIEIYKLPIITDGFNVVEKKYCEILNKYRAGEILDVEILDWMDYANNFLSTSEGISNERS